MENREKGMQIKSDLRTLESMYVNSKIDNLEEIAKEKRDKLADELTEYKENILETKRTKDGEEYQVPNLNPLVIQSYFFKSINPIGSREPEYNAEKLAIVFELYMDILTNVNIYIGEFIPNISSFCTFAGITTSTFNNYKRSADIDMRTICEKINDYCFNSNVSLAQKGNVSEKSTIYRMKVEQDKSEKAEPQIHIHANDLDLGMVKDRLKELEDFNRNKEKYVKVESKEKGKHE